jgi:hypothetical protein
VDTGETIPVLGPVLSLAVSSMGPRAVKLITGTRLGARGIRAPREKVARVRSGINKLQRGLVDANKVERYIKGLVAQLRLFIIYARKMQLITPESSAELRSDEWSFYSARPW